MAFKDIDVTNYIIDVFIPEDDFTMCKVKATGPRGNWNTLRFPSMDINWLKSRGQPDSNIRHCPSMAAPNKAGRPKKGKRINGPLEGGKCKKWG